MVASLCGVMACLLRRKPIWVAAYSINGLRDVLNFSVFVVNQTLSLQEIEDITGK